ncbi:LysR substrate-binding domain-containing protein [Chelatococcus asaccharovorans]|uniref:LysR family transcriptional regulator n=1 Tax=Chelatococcus asaccharovorans TaxID=28210 RepID=A0A2V3TWT0_9HYPH|nr:LysR substrate-binding domain-containing protein [Chelatococcus asaccharovorans]MBS7705136.1 LysR family transcriptional regulator [Chelatococcus asaccharovorans]PXW53631.1 LysR family transcriptional regulator [Chelatococcus asaccharovorans]
MNLRQIEIFQAVMRTGSITAGAELLNLSQPAVSRQIERLEKVSRIKLFHRVGRGLQPTPEGVAFYEEVKRAFVGLENLRHFADNITNFNTGHLRIASLPALGFGFLPRVITSFSELYPNVEVSLQVRSSGFVRGITSTQEFDLGFLPGPPNDLNHHAEHFAGVDCVCILPAGHPLAAKTEIVPADIAGLPFIRLVKDDVTRQQVDHILENAGFTLKQHIETQFAATVCSFVISGAGVSVLSPFAAADFAGHGLVMRRFRPLVRASYAMVMPVLRPPSAVTRKFIAVLAEARNKALAQFEAI